jgi:hypothetical protein
VISEDVLVVSEDEAVSEKAAVGIRNGQLEGMSKD